MNADYQRLSMIFHHFAGLTPEEFEMSLPYWQYRTYNKGEYYNRFQSVCTHFGFIVNGFFRSYVLDQKTEQEKNVFFYPENQFVVTFKSFSNQLPCEYYTQALADATVLCISFEHLHQLYAQSHAWERIGRLLAQRAFNAITDRIKETMLETPEQRYLNLIQRHPDIFNQVPLYHIASYLNIQGPSLSRIRKRLSTSAT